MAILNGYSDVSTWTARYWKAASPNLPTTATVEQIIEAASRAIDGYCRRVFYTTGSAPSSYSTRYFTAASSGVCKVTDLLTISAISLDAGDYTYGVTLATTDYVTMPGIDGWPTTWIEAAPLGNYRFPSHSKGVKIAGIWGFATAIPKPIVEACLIQSNRWYSRMTNPYGTAGGNEGVPTINIARLDPDIESTLSQYVKAQVG